MDETERKEKWMKLLIIFAVVVVFAITALEIAEYLYQRENKAVDDILDDLIEEMEHRGKEDRR